MSVKIYLATSGEYSDYRVVAAFTREEDARAYPLAEDVEECELRDGPADVRPWHVLFWKPYDPDLLTPEGQVDDCHIRGSNPRWIDHRLRDYDGEPRHVEHDWPEYGVKGLRVEGWDRAAVLKVYSEQRAQHLAREQGIS